MNRPLLLVLAPLALLLGCEDDPLPDPVPPEAAAPDAAPVDALEAPAEAPDTSAEASPECAPEPVQLFISRILFDGEGCVPGLDCGYLPNGPLLNGTRPGTDPAGTGTVLETASYAGAQAADGSPVTASLKDGEMVLSAIDGSGVAVAGARLQGVRQGPATRSPVRLRVDGVEKQGDLFLYDISYEHAGSAGCPTDVATSAWRPLCTDGDRPTRAVLVDAVWDYGSGERGNGDRRTSATDFTIACLDTSAIAKCIQIGYRPWARRPGCDTPGPACSMAGHHQACVRAVRGDFCNNGFPLTDPGTTIRVYDVLTVNAKRPGSKGEASWGADGSQCISETRLASLVATQGTSRPFNVRDYIDRVCPGKFTATGREPWGGLCAAGAATLPDVEQVFTEFPDTADGGVMPAASPAP